jgi:hypothetical protein
LVGLVADKPPNAIVACEIVSECTNAVNFPFRVNIVKHLKPLLLHVNPFVAMRVLQCPECVVENGRDNVIGMFPALISKCDSLVARLIGFFARRFASAFPDFRASG